MNDGQKRKIRQSEREDDRGNGTVTPLSKSGRDNEGSSYSLIPSLTVWILENKQWLMLPSKKEILQLPSGLPQAFINHCTFLNFNALSLCGSM